MSVHVFLLIGALVCFIIKAIGINTGRIECMNLGFAFIVGSMLV